MIAWPRACWIGSRSEGDAFLRSAGGLADTWITMAPGEATRETLAGVALIVNAAPLLPESHADLAERLEQLDAVHGTRRIVNLVPVSWLGSPTQPVAGARAAFWVGFIRGLAAHHADLVVTVNTVVITQPISVADLAHAVAFFADPENDYVTGQTLQVRGAGGLEASLSA